MKLDYFIDKKVRGKKIKTLEKQMYELYKEVLILQTRLNELEDELTSKEILEGFR